MTEQDMGMGPQPAPAAQPAADQAAWSQPPRYAPSYAQTYAQQPGWQAPPPAWQAAPAAPQPPAKKRGWIVALVFVVLFFALCFFGVASCSSALSGGCGDLGPWNAGNVEGFSGETVGIIEIAGDIAYDGSTCSPEGLKEQLDIAEADPNVKAVVLRVNSGGGTATAGEEMTVYVRDFSKPVVVSSAAINASAAYELSSQADYIFTAKSTAIGAIGTALQITDLSGLYDMLGIKVENIVSSDSKDSSYGTRGLTDEERAYYQAQIDEINENFIESVAEGRGMDKEEVRALATGLTFTGTDAVENGLADEIGTLEDALDKAAALGGISGASYDVAYLYPASDGLLDLMSLLYASRGDAALDSDLKGALGELRNHVGSQR